jgi:predicted ribosomally synthesized peptide with nif11-like leader
MKPFTPYHRQAMSEEQLAALLAKLKDDAGLQEKLKGAAGLDAAVALAKEAGFDVSKADLLKYQATQILELSDDELEGVAGGRNTDFCTRGHCPAAPCAASCDDFQGHATVNYPGG